AATTGAGGNALASFAANEGIECFRGSEEDVVKRLLGTGIAYSADAVVRISGDCPLIDPEVVDLVTRAFRKGGWQIDYASNVYPSTFPHGLDVEILSLDLLERLDRDVDDPFYRDWFSAYVREHPDDFAMVNVTTPTDLHELRWTVDYPEDLEFVEQVFRYLGPHGERFGMVKVLSLLEQHPELRQINQHLEDRQVVRGIRSATYHHVLAERARAMSTEKVRPEDRRAC
ncbi:MAG: hypothetical protein ACE5MM_06755, partial [Nitrospiraceae bacterium]